jgi:DNA-binding transcriptional LysR family regulator
MRREDLGDLAAFLAVADARSFTRAAALLGTSQSALSHTVRRLETRLGLRLLVRTTRSVAPTEAGERLIETLRPALGDIDDRITALAELRDRPSGTIRITAGEHSAHTILWPAFEKLLPRYPEIRVEIATDQSLTDIVEGRYDAGVRLGEQVAADMIAVRIGPDLNMVVVGSSSWFETHPKPQTPHELTDHACINLRLPTLGGLYAWEFEKGGRELNVRVDGPLVFNDMRLIIKAAEAGMGLAFVMADQVVEQIADGRLIPVLEDWRPPFSGYHLYYPSRRQPTSAFAVVVDALRWRDPA